MTVTDTDADTDFHVVELNRYHRCQNYCIPFSFVFWRTIFGNYDRKLDSIKFLGELINVI